MGRYSYSSLTTLRSDEIGTWVVSVYPADGGYVVESTAIGEHGWGQTEEGAAKDFVSVILAYRDALERREGTLGPELRRHLELIRKAQPGAFHASVQAVV